MTNVKEHIRNQPKQILTTIGVVLTIAFGLIGIYTNFFYNKSASLRYEVISNTPVLDVREDISKLDILYNNRSIKETGQALRIISIRIINNGDDYINKSDYDENDPLGFRVINGQLIERVELLDASNDYLKANVAFRNLDSNKVSISSVIIEPEDFFLFRILVLHNSSVEPQVQPRGKIAGIRKFEFAEPYKENEKLSYFQEAFVGSILVHIGRFFLYIIIIVIVVILISIPISISGKVRKRRRIKIVKSFNEKYISEISQNSEAILDAYVKHGDEILKIIKSSISGVNLWPPSQVSYYLDHGLERHLATLHNPNRSSKSERKLAEEFLEFVLNRTN